MDAEQVKAKIRTRHGALKDQDHYQVLGVDAKADTSTIKSAFRTLIREFHTDRFARFDLGDCAEQLQALLARFNEAHVVLADATKRKNYDADLESGGGGEVSAEEFTKIFAAEDAFRKGKNLVERGEFDAAEMKFELALEVNPDDAETLAYYAFTWFMNEPLDASGDRTQRALEMHADLERISNENPQLLIAHLFYGKTLKLMGKTKKSIAAFEKVLQLKPNNTEAVRELRIMKQRDEDESREGLVGRLKGMFKKLKK